jgi:hypothetical protein
VKATSEGQSFLSLELEDGSELRRFRGKAGPRFTDLTGTQRTRIGLRSIGVERDRTFYDVARKAVSKLAARADRRRGHEPRAGDYLVQPWAPSASEKDALDDGKSSRARKDTWGVPDKESTHVPGADKATHGPIRAARPGPELRAALGVAFPDDFPNFEGDAEVALVDSLIVELLALRRDLSAPTPDPIAVRKVERLRRAAVPFGDAVTSSEKRRAMLSYLLDTSMTVPPEHGTAFVQTLANWATRKSIDSSLVRPAVELWPQRKQREKRSRAVHDLARALDCDCKSLMTLLRQARTDRLRQRGKRDSRAKAIRN